MNEFENVVALGPRELCARQLLQTSDSGSDDGALQFQDRADRVEIEGMKRNASNERDEAILKMPDHPPPTSGL